MRRGFDSSSLGKSNICSCCQTLLTLNSRTWIRNQSGLRVDLLSILKRAELSKISVDRLHIVLFYRQLHMCRKQLFVCVFILRWCVGSEKTWKIRLKYLVVLPLILLAITVLCIFLSEYHVSDKDQLVNKSKAAGM